jgi:two-component system, LytTR family, response regulator
LVVKSVNHRLIIKTVEGTHLIPYVDIVHCIAESNYCMIRLKGAKQILVSKTLKYIESHLPASLFLRVHQSHLINKSNLRFIGKEHIILDDMEKVPLSRARKAILMQHIND